VQQQTTNGIPVETLAQVSMTEVPAKILWTTANKFFFINIKKIKIRWTTSGSWPVPGGESRDGMCFIFLFAIVSISDTYTN
jgi:hypothetical protein